MSTTNIVTDFTTKLSLRRKEHDGLVYLRTKGSQIFGVGQGINATPELVREIDALLTSNRCD